MAENYVRPISQAIQELDGFRYRLDSYMGFGWEGLKDNAHPTLLTNEEFKQFLISKANIEKTTKFNPSNCN